MKSLLCIILSLTVAAAQLLQPRISDPVPAEVNAMYDQGLQFLLNAQSADGSWSEPVESQPAIIAFSLMAVMARGLNLNEPKYRTFVKNCLDSLLKAQDSSSGYIGNNMYNHGFVTLALAEAYGHIDDDRLGPAVKKATDLILESQKKNPKKAWRYTPDSNDADSTVTGCQIVALIGARNAGINVPKEAIDNGIKYLQSCRASDGSYGYTDNNGGRPTLTAIAVLSHHLAQTKGDQFSEQSINYLTRRLNYRDQHYPFYYEYYMAQALFQADEKTWETWNKRNIRYLKLIQDNDGSWSNNIGKVYATSAALMSLAVNYRLIPIYEKF